MTNKIFKTGSQPGKGRYLCSACKGDVVLDDDTDRMPPCAKCHKTEFTSAVQIKEDKKAKPTKDMIKVMAEEGGRFASNRGGTHTELILNKGGNIITKAQFELCKDAPGIKKL